MRCFSFSGIIGTTVLQERFAQGWSGFGGISGPLSFCMRLLPCVFLCQQMNMKKPGLSRSDGARFGFDAGRRLAQFSVTRLASCALTPAKALLLSAVQCYWWCTLHHGNVALCASCASQSVKLRYQTRGNVLPLRKLRFAEGETALSNARERVAFAQVALRRG